jgi:HK97 family phage major capsid protein
MYDFSEMNGEQLEARKAELIAGMTDPETRDGLSAEDLEGRKAEIEAIDAETESRVKAAQAAEELRQEVAEGHDPVVKTFEKTEDRKMTYEINSPEYRDAFLRNLQGKELTAEERTAVVGTAAIPTQTMNEIVHKLELNPLIAAVDLTQIPGYVTYPAEGTVNNAAWVDMGTAATDAADTLTSITLGAYKLIKTVEITADVDAMSVDAFEAWLVARLVNKIEKALDAGILNGGGSTSGECLGIKTSKSTADYKYTKAAMNWKDLTAIIGALPGQYHNEASFVMPPALFYGEVLGMVDSTNNRVVVMDPQSPRKYNILGFPAIIDGNAATDEVYFGDLKAYKMNLAKAIEVKKSEEAEFRKGSMVYRAMTLADGKLADVNAIVRAIRST